jgi:hypothetical protein
LSDAQRAQLDQLTAFYAARRASSSYSARVAYGRLRYEPALRWSSGDDEGYVAIEALRWLADQPADVVEPAMQWLLPQVLRLQHSRGWILDTTTLIWARFDNATAQAFRDTLAPQELADTARDVILQHNLPPEAMKRAYAELVRLKVDPEWSFVRSLAERYGDRPETAELFNAWGPNAVGMLVKVSGEHFRGEDKVRLDKLLAALGVAAAPPNYELSEQLLAFADAHEPPMPPTLNMVMFCKHDWKPEDIEADIERLTHVPEDQLARAWFDRRAAVAHLTARALARTAPARLAKELELHFFVLAPVAKIVEENSASLAQVPEDQEQLYRMFAPPMWEAVAALAELDEVPAPAINAMWAAVESPSARLADKAAEGLEKKRSTAQFVEGLFAHLSVKEKYEVRELDAVVKRVAAHADAGPPIAKALEAVLKAKEGRPEGVPLVHKYVAFKALALLKDPKTKPTVQKFLKDSTVFVEDKVTKLRDGTVTHAQEAHAIAELAKAAL